MIKSSTMANWDRTTGDPFITQNNFVTNAVSGGVPIFHKLKSDVVGTFKAEFDASETNTPDNKGIYDIYFL